MTRREGLAWAGVFALVLALQIVALRGQSLIGDEPHHFLAGYQALAHGTNTLNLEHPPAIKLVAAAPLLIPRRGWVGPTSADRALATAPTLFEAVERAHRARLGGRGLLLLLVALPLLVGVALLGAEVRDTRTGLTLAALLGLSSSVLPNLSLAQTDGAVALGFALGLLGAVKLASRWSVSAVLLAGLGLGIACASKFSGLLLVPVVAAAILGSRMGSRRRRSAALLLVGTLAAGILTGSYALANYRYDSAAGREAIRLYAENRASVVTEDRLLAWEPRLLALERISPELAQLATGVLAVAAQNAVAPYPSYAFGELSSDGRWWFFPAVFAVKTPLVILLALLAGLLSARARLPWVLGLALISYLALALGSNYNIGLRHLLPITPLLYLPAASWLSASSRRLVLSLAILALEAVWLAPLWVSATNTWWLGERNPTRFALSAGDNEMRQSFLALADAARARGIAELRVLYPLLSEAELRAYLPRGRTVAPGQSVEEGWYAVSVIVEQYVPALLAPADQRLHDRAGLEALARAWEPLWREVARGRDCGYVAGTFHLYRLGGPCDGA